MTAFFLLCMGYTFLCFFFFFGGRRRRRRRRFGCRHTGRTPCDRDAAAGQGMPRTAINRPKLEEARKGFYPKSQRECDPANPLILDFWSLEPRENTFLLFQATWSVAFCYDDLRKLTHRDSGRKRGALWEGNVHRVLGERGREITAPWERGDVLWGKRKFQRTYFLVLIFLEFKTPRKKRWCELGVTNTIRENSPQIVLYGCIRFHQNGWYNLRNGANHLS